MNHKKHMTAGSIGDETGCYDGEEFASPEDVRMYFTVESFRLMFGECKEDQETLDAWAETVIHTDFQTQWKCDDGNCEIEIEADTAEEAAQEYVDGGEWGVNEFGKTAWIEVRVWPASMTRQEAMDDGEDEAIMVRVDPDEPECDSEDGHDWQESGSIGNGGGVITTEVCRRCDCRRTTNTADNDLHGRPVETIKYEQL
jgi:hypothetical protein